MAELAVYLEVGQKKCFAAAVDWPGWCRAGRDEPSALEALLDYRDRYAAALDAIIKRLPAPRTTDSLKVIDRLKGDATTDFGAPGGIPAVDRQHPTKAEVERWLAMLAACWSRFDQVAQAAEGKTLASGPRGGGRSLASIREHVHGAHQSYTRQVGGTGDFEEAVWARWRGELPDKGPRGGERWPPRYAIRRAAWHILDHAWEIEDRLPG